MKKLHMLTRTGLLILLFALPSLADGWIVRVANTSAVQTLTRLYGATVLSSIHDSDGLYRINLPSGPLGNLIAQALKASPLVQDIEPDTVVVMPKPASAYNPNGRSLANLPTSCSGFTIPGTQLPTNTYQKYLTQASNCIVQLPAAHSKFGNGAGATVAVIDTGVDWSHPVLAASVDVMGARDFTGNNDPTGTVAQETSPMVDQETSPMVDQETSPMVDSSGTIILNQETSPMVDQETSPMVDSTGKQLPKALGHGTMVAGIIHLVAPYARILPVKAFTNDGFASLSSIVSALYYAADRGVDVINASWSTGTASKELQAAVNYALAHKVIIVAAVANQSSPNAVYPAAQSNVIGVGCTDNTDARCSFSNYGNDVVLGAPGSGITSTFPMRYSRTGFATGWGTSFSAPYVAGTVALIHSIKWNTSAGKAEEDLSDGAANLPKSLGLGAGRLNVYGAVSESQ